MCSQSCSYSLFNDLCHCSISLDDDGVFRRGTRGGLSHVTVSDAAKKIDIWTQYNLADHIHGV